MTPSTILWPVTTAIAVLATSQHALDMVQTKAGSQLLRFRTVAFVTMCRQNRADFIFEKRELFLRHLSQRDRGKESGEGDQEDGANAFKLTSSLHGRSGELSADDFRDSVEHSIQWSVRRMCCARARDVIVFLPVAGSRRATCSSTSTTKRATMTSAAPRDAGSALSYDACSTRPTPALAARKPEARYP